MNALRGVVALAVLALAAPAASHAQGFQISEHGMCATARGGTGIALPCADGSAIWFNPAGIVGRRGLTVGLGGHVVVAGGNFTDDVTQNVTDIQNSPIPVPHAYLTYGVSERLAFGIGAFVPYGLGTEWPVEFEGRYLGYDNYLQSIYVQPTVAVRPHPVITIGAGVDAVLSTVRLTQRIDLAPVVLDPATGTTFGQLGIPVGTDFANVVLDGSGRTRFTAHVGIILQPADWFRIGARYLSRTRVTYDGKVDFEPVETGIILPPGNPISLAEPLLPDDQPLPLDDVLAAQGLFLPGRELADSTGEASIAMPDQLRAGIAVRVRPSLWVLAEWGWTNWSEYDRVPVDFDNAATPDLVVDGNYEDVHTFKAGIDWALSPRWTVRAGYLRHAGASPDEHVTPLLPEGDRNAFSGGFGWRMSDRFTIDVGYQYVRQDKRRGRVVDPPPGLSPQQVVDEINSGVYTFGGHQIGTTLTMRFF
jgi:long-chain fatty acid transport protein